MARPSTLEELTGVWKNAEWCPPLLSCVLLANGIEPRAWQTRILLIGVRTAAMGFWVSCAMWQIGVLVSKLHWKVFFADFYLRRCTQQSTRVTSTQFRSFPPLSKADLTLGVIIFHREIEALHHGKNCQTWGRGHNMLEALAHFWGIYTAKQWCPGFQTNNDRKFTHHRFEFLSTRRKIRGSTASFNQRHSCVLVKLLGHINCTMLLQSAVANLSMSLAHHVWIFCFHPCCPALAIPSPRFVVMKHNQYIHAGCTYPMLVMCRCHVFMVIVIRREAQEKNMLLLAGFSWGVHAGTANEF